MKESSTTSELFFFTSEVFVTSMSSKADLSLFIVVAIFDNSIGDEISSNFCCRCVNVSLRFIMSEVTAIMLSRIVASSVCTSFDFSSAT